MNFTKDTLTDIELHKMNRAMYASIGKNCFEAFPSTSTWVLDRANEVYFAKLYMDMRDTNFSGDTSYIMLSLRGEISFWKVDRGGEIDEDARKTGIRQLTRTFTYSTMCAINCRKPGHPFVTPPLDPDAPQAFHDAAIFMIKHEDDKYNAWIDALKPPYPPGFALSDNGTPYRVQTTVILR